jgi:hypothetical protein
VLYFVAAGWLLPKHAIDFYLDSIFTIHAFYLGSIFVIGATPQKPDALACILLGSGYTRTHLGRVLCAAV